MTSDQSKKLKIGARVCFDGDQAEGGWVIATDVRHVTIKWDDGHTSYTGHKEMKRVKVL